MLCGATFSLSCVLIAGYVTFNFWKMVFQKLGLVRTRAHLTSSSTGQQALTTSSQHTYTTGDTGEVHSPIYWQLCALSLASYTCIPVLPCMSAHSFAGLLTHSLTYLLICSLTL